MEKQGAAPSLSEVLPALTTAWRNLSVYPAGHPARAAALETAYRRLTAVLAASGPLSLGVTKEGVAYGETRLAAPPVRALCEALQRRSVEVLRFEEGLELRELEAFLRCLGDAKGPLERPPLQRELAQADVARVVITPVDYSALALTEAVAPRRVETYSAQGIASLLPGAEAGPSVTADRNAQLEALSAAVESHVRDTQGPARETAVHQIAGRMRALPRDVREALLAAALKVLASDQSTPALRLARRVHPARGHSCGGRMRLLAMVEEPANVARFLAAMGEPTEVPRRSPGRGPPYWKSRVLRRQALGDEDDGQGRWVPHSPVKVQRASPGPAGVGERPE